MNTMWTAIAACATAIMAVATFFLALKTRSMAEETKAVAEATLKEAHAVEKQVEQVERQVSISAEALRASAQPWLVWEPSFEVESDGMGPVGYRHGGFYLHGSHTCFQVIEKDTSVEGWFTVRNVGNGIAILDMSKSFIFRQDNTVSYDDVHPSVETPVVPPGGMVDVEFKIPASRSADHQKMTLSQLAGGGGHQSFMARSLTAIRSGTLGRQQSFEPTVRMRTVSGRLSRSNTGWTTGRKSPLVGLASRHRSPTHRSGFVLNPQRHAV